MYVTAGTKQGHAPVVQKGMNTLAFFCFCTQALFDVRRSAFLHWEDQTVFNSTFLPLRLFSWVAKVHSSLLDSPQIDSVLSRELFCRHICPINSRRAECSLLWDRGSLTKEEIVWVEVELEVELVPTSNLLSSNAPRNPDHDIGSSAVQTQSVMMTRIKSKDIEALYDEVRTLLYNLDKYI